MWCERSQQFIPKILLPELFYHMTHVNKIGLGGKGIKINGKYLNNWRLTDDNVVTTNFKELLEDRH